MNSGNSSTELNDMLTNFVEYVDMFYGTSDGDETLYPLINKKNGQPLNTVDIYRATENYLAKCSDENETLCTWGDGDSLDRERVRDILLAEFGYTHKEA